MDIDVPSLKAVSSLVTFRRLLQFLASLLMLRHVVFLVAPLPPLQFIKFVFNIPSLST
jgi:hypothetical protein